MLPLDRFLAALESQVKVKRSGSGNYIACCPAHDDKSPSLTVSEASDGRVLVYCFAGCETEAVVLSLGLRMTDLFPPSNDFDRRQWKAELEAKARVEQNLFDRMLIQIAQSDIAKGINLSPVDREVVGAAMDRRLLNGQTN